jgi:hypothetical protein
MRGARGANGGKKLKKKRDPLEKLLSDESLLNSDDDDEKAIVKDRKPESAEKSLFVKTYAPTTTTTDTLSVSSAKSAASSSGASSTASVSTTKGGLSALFKDAAGRRPVGGGGGGGISRHGRDDMSSRSGALADEAFYAELGLVGGRGGGRQAIGKPTRGGGMDPDLEYSSDDSDIAMFSGGDASGRGGGGGGGGGGAASARAKGGSSGAGGASATGDQITVFFGEHLDEPLTVDVATPTTTLGEFLETALAAWFRERGALALKGHLADHYNVYLMDDDELDTDTTFKHTLPVLSIGEKSLGFGANPSATPRVVAAAGTKDAESARMERLESIAKMVFVRVRVPGPGARVLTLKFDDDQASMTLRDLYFELNRKKQEVFFHALYFDMYYDGESAKGEPLSNMLKITDLKKPNLIVLPKHMSESDPHSEDAFQYPLVRLAYESREWQANKIRSGKKKGRLLGVNYFKITKQESGTMSSSGMSSTKKGGFLSSMTGKIRKTEHVPIEITDVGSATILAEDPKQCKLTYRHVKHGLTTHYYEMSSSQECKDFVDKVSFLVELHKLRPM